MNRGKSPIKSKKYQLLIKAARDLFMRYGIKKVTVEEICSTAGVSKMTFYKHFNNKIELALFILNQTFEDGVRRYKIIMSQDVPYAEKARQLIRLKLESTEDVSREMTKDILDSPIPEVAAMMRKISEENFNLFLNDMISAQKKGEIRGDINPHFIMYVLGKLQEMAVDERFSSMYASTQALSSEILNFFFYGIMSREKE